MPVPLPGDADVKLTPPDRQEVDVLGCGIVAAVTPPGGLTTLQDLLLRAVFHSMTGYSINPSTCVAMAPQEFAEALRYRNAEFRTRIVQVMLLGELILVPLPDEVAERVKAYAAQLDVDDGMIEVARRYAQGSLGLALIDFNRNGYTAEWDPGHAEQLHTKAALAEAWEQACHDPDLVARWTDLGNCASGSLGRAVFDFYEARGFTFPGLPDSAPPFLAQHDWVHVLADYGTTVESELEVFGLIGRSIPDPRGFSLLAMVVGLFETGYLPAAAGLFHSDAGHLRKTGVAERLADAMRRGALCGKDLMAVDYFTYADHQVADVREELGITPKSETAVAAGSVGPWSPGGISPFQLRSGMALADAQGRPYDAHGAKP